MAGAGVLGQVEMPDRDDGCFAVGGEVDFDAAGTGRDAVARRLPSPAEHEPAWRIDLEERSACDVGPVVVDPEGPADASLNGRGSAHPSDETLFLRPVAEDGCRI